MKRMITNCAAGIVLLAAATTTHSCIFGVPDGEYVYNTVWQSDQAPLSPLHVNGLTLDFTCNCTITLDTDSGSTQYFAIYDCNIENAYFQNLTIPIDGTSVTFIDGIRTGTTLDLSWRLDSDMSLHTTRLQLVKEYD